jgi:dTDP-4-dehydrorhamnose 3,5-epimerase
VKITSTALAEVLIIEPDVYGDDRGFFFESFNPKIKEALGGVTFVQDNDSRSSKGVLRGLHYQSTKPQGKLIRAISGSIFDVAVDIRRDSPTFGQSVTMELSEKNHLMLWIAPGMAHGFLALSESVDILYKVTTPYDGSDERTIIWNDPSLNIPWPLSGPPLLSGKDKRGRRLEEAV